MCAHVCMYMPVCVCVPACVNMCKVCVVSVLMHVNGRACYVNASMRAQECACLFVCNVRCMCSWIFASNVQVMRVRVNVLVYVQGMCGVCSCTCVCKVCVICRRAHARCACLCVRAHVFVRVLRSHACILVHVCTCIRCAHGHVCKQCACLCAFLPACISAWELVYTVPACLHMHPCNPFYKHIRTTAYMCAKFEYMQAASSREMTSSVLL